MIALEFPIGTVGDCYYPPDSRLKPAFWYGNQMFRDYKTDGIHSFMLGPTTLDGDQYIIEALITGVTVGRLSGYKQAGKIRFYQNPRETQAQALLSWEKAHAREGDPYDFGIYGLIFVEAQAAYARNWYRPIQPEALFDDGDREEMCYELVFKAKAEAGVPVLGKAMGTPWATRKAAMLGNLRLIGEWK